MKKRTPREKRAPTIIEKQRHRERRIKTTCSNRRKKTRKAELKRETGRWER